MSSSYYDEDGRQMISSAENDKAGMTFEDVPVNSHSNIWGDNGADSQFAGFDLSDAGRSPARHRSEIPQCGGRA